MRGFNYRKAVQALNFLSIKEGGRINKMKSIKLIWLADRHHLRTHGRTITGDIYFALKHGPVPSTTRDILESNSFSLDEDELHYSKEYISITDSYNYRSNTDVDIKVFSKTEIQILESIYTVYGKYDQFDLRDISHAFPEWKKYESALNKRLSSRFPMDYIDFFEDAVPGYDKIQINPEVKKLSKEFYLEASEITDFFNH